MPEVCVCIYACVRVHVHVRVSVCVCVPVHAYMRVYVVCVCGGVCVWRYVRVCACMHACARLRMHVCVCVCPCVCLFRHSSWRTRASPDDESAAPHRAAARHRAASHAPSRPMHTNQTQAQVFSWASLAGNCGRTRAHVASCVRVFCTAQPYIKTKQNVGGAGPRHARRLGSLDRKAVDHEPGAWAWGVGRGGGHGPVCVGGCLQAA